MNRAMFVVSAIGMGAVVGCSTVDPLKVSQTKRDLMTYEAKDEKPEREGQYKIAVISRMNSACHIEPFVMKIVAEQVEKAVTEDFSNLGWFETVDRKNGMALVAESTLKGDSIDAASLPGADIALVADSFAYYLKDVDRPVATAGQATGVRIETDFRLIDLSTKQPLLAKKISNIEFGKSKVASSPYVIDAASKKNARAFAKLVAARFLPGAKVLQTRGDGRYAQIGLGKTYLVEDGSKIEFFTEEKQKNGRYDENVFAQGVVLGKPGQHLEGGKAWVEVSDYGAAHVLKGHKARVTEE